jgi:hypothetical protein
VISFKQFVDRYEHKIPIWAVICGTILGILTGAYATVVVFDVFWVELRFVRAASLFLMMLGQAILGMFSPYIIGFVIVKWNEKYKLAEKELSCDGYTFLPTFVKRSK